MWRALIFIACLVVTGGCRGRSPTAVGADADRGTVVAVIDGDTVDVDMAAGPVERIRLLGIDTPETVDPDRPVGCYGPEASAAAHDLLPVGTEVRLERDTEARDRYGRLLAYVFRQPDGLLVNEALAAAGAAEILSIPPNTAYADRLSSAVAAARSAGAGLWGAC